MKCIPIDTINNYLYSIFSKYIVLLGPNISYFGNKLTFLFKLNYSF